MTIHIPDEVVEAVADAIEEARCPGREGPFGGYDYGHNTDFYGPAPEGGRYVIRDFRYPHSKGEWLFQTNDHAVYEETFQKMTREHTARAALTAALKAWVGTGMAREAAVYNSFGGQWKAFTETDSPDGLIIRTEAPRT